MQCEERSRLTTPIGGGRSPQQVLNLSDSRPSMSELGKVYNDKEVTQAIAELIRLHDDVLARVFALQTLLQELDLVSRDEVQDRTDQFRRQFASNLEARLAALQEKTVAAEIQQRQRIVDEFGEPQE